MVILIVKIAWRTCRLWVVLSIWMVIVCCLRVFAWPCVDMGRTMIITTKNVRERQLPRVFSLPLEIMHYSQEAKYPCNYWYYQGSNGTYAWPRSSMIQIIVMSMFLEMELIKRCQRLHQINYKHETYGHKIFIIHHFF